MTSSKCVQTCSDNDRGTAPSPTQAGNSPDSTSCQPPSSHAQSTPAPPPAPPPAAHQMALTHGRHVTYPLVTSPRHQSMTSLSPGAPRYDVYAPALNNNHVRTRYAVFFGFLARDSMLSALYAIANPSVRPSVCLSVRRTGGSVENG